MPVVSAFSTAMSAADARIQAVLAEALTHTAGAAGGETSVTGRFEEEDPDLADVSDGQATIRRATATIPVSELASIVAGDRISRDADDESWTVQTARLVSGGASTEVSLSRIEHREKSRQGFRVPR